MTLHVPPLHRGIRRWATLPLILGEPAVAANPLTLPHDPERTWIGWGVKRSGRSAAWVARRRGERCLRLEDGFLRSHAPGGRAPPLSLVADDLGIYYDSTRPSRLEHLLEHGGDLLGERAGELDAARRRIVAGRLSKYSAAPALSPDNLDAGARARVLVVDQTRGDLSVRLGGADATTFRRMLDAARAENPDAAIWVKTHPQTAGGAKRGYLTDVDADARTRVVREPVAPQSLFAAMDRVYVVTSHMGFEALMAGVPVSCFGRPWYAGWGMTDDRQACPRRTRRRGVLEAFAAAYVHYTHYLDPERHAPGTVFDVIAFLERQKADHARIAGSTPGRVIPVGFSRRKHHTMGPVLTPTGTGFAPADTVREAAHRAPGPADTLIAWGDTASPDLTDLGARTGARVRRMEDGFIRSVGLGSNFVPPMSVVLDSRGMYFDPAQPSDLEHILNTRDFTDDDLARARRVRETIVRERITKYNLEDAVRPAWAEPGVRTVFVPGQVEDDASIRRGCPAVATNAGLLQAARAAEPDARIVYKPHPDVMARNRVGAVADATIAATADVVETRVNVISCVEAADAVHTLTSLTGFDALLRGKAVTVHGCPFYAGWGLTHDRAAMPRRHRWLTLDMLVAGALLHYPVYWDWTLRGYTSCEAVLARIVEQRARLARSGRLDAHARGRVDQWAAQRLLHLVRRGR